MTISITWGHISPYPLSSWQRRRMKPERYVTRRLTWPARAQDKSLHPTCLVRTSTGSPAPQMAPSFSPLSLPECVDSGATAKHAHGCARCAVAPSPTLPSSPSSSPMPIPATLPLNGGTIHTIAHVVPSHFLTLPTPHPYRAGPTPTPDSRPPVTFTPYG